MQKVKLPSDEQPRFGDSETGTRGTTGQITASMASLMITTETMVAEKPKREPTTITSKPTWVTTSEEECPLPLSKTGEWRDIMDGQLDIKNNLDDVKGFLTLSGSELLHRLLDEQHPEQFVRRLPNEDFYWLIKKIGTDDCLPVLELASTRQWEYLLDLELWQKDRFDTKRTIEWLNRLAEADPHRLSDWLLGEAREIFSLFLFRTAEVVFNDGSDAPELSGAYFTVDGSFYFRALCKEDQEPLERLIKILLRNDYEKWQELLYSLPAVIPAELEEELYRLRNVRLAEHGFLPYEEALIVYAPLKPSFLKSRTRPLLPGYIIEAGEDVSLPVSTIINLSDERFMGALSLIEDRLIKDRILLEFTGLCNRIIAAGGFQQIDDHEILNASCRRAASYVNLALEGMCGKDNEAAEILINYSLIDLFRIGYGLAVDFRHKVLRWVKGSWFAVHGKGNDFWGTPWQETLDGLCATHPLFFDEAGEKHCLRDFRTMGELDDTKRRIRQVQTLDLLLARLDRGTKDEEGHLDRVKTYHPLIFNRWARSLLGLDVSSRPITLSEAVEFFRFVRKEEKAPPYKMEGYRERFIRDFMEGGYDLSDIDLKALREAIIITWETFRTEYENIKEADLDGRYSPHILIETK